MQFAHAWAAHARSFFGANPPHCTPLFDPTQLDQHAAVASSPDPEKVGRARALPIHRFDRWDSDAPGYPSWIAPSVACTKPPAEELGHLELSPSTRPPWPTWDLSLPVEHLQIRFGAEAIAKMKKAAEDSLPESLSGQQVSRLDSVLAHVWILMNRARQHENTQDIVYLNNTLGLRNRVEPPLPDSYVGSPILLAYVEKTGYEVSTATIGSIAGSIRQVMSQFTPDAVSDYLHEVAHEVCPQRLWQAFLGSRHTIVTSWVRARAYEVDFCATQQQARYMQGVMPRLDGLVQVIDIADTGAFDISVCLEKETLQRFAQDPMLKAYGF
ncbi:transferase family-domain-containing protein [Hypoxylon fragiforme]|uniref:transferase family-domain-containing protein n=1 Tax=Hypoxylon fragiforme TaxID=63214 RepID=UPI0020C66789|nr:transferase family-domain-containing protein [Hypoxylon fragiforme]KAI2609969.1 transferase family-domain-containing protein [Hypoxylon fragiforme]